MSQTKSTNAQQIKRAFFTISFLYTLSASIIWGVNTLFLLGAGLNIQEVFVANAFFALGSALFEIPTGVFADTRGRRFSFLMSVFVLALATLGYVVVSLVGGGVFWFSLSSVFLGLGFTFYTGAVEAWVVDELRASGSTEDLDPVFARGAAISGIAMFIGTIGGGFLGTANLVYPYFVRSGLLVALFFFGLFFMQERGFSPAKNVTSGYFRAVGVVTKDSIQFGWKDRVVRLIIIATVVQSVFMMWGFYGWQPYLLDMLGRRDAAWISGFVAAAVAFATVIGNSCLPIIRKFIHRRSIILLAGVLVMAAGSIVMGATNSFALALGALIVMMIAMGASMPVKQAYLHQKTPSEKRATVISFDALLGSGGGFIGQTGLGWVARRFGLSTGYIIGGVILSLAAPVYGALRRRRDVDDVIEQT